MTDEQGKIVNTKAIASAKTQKEPSYTPSLEAKRTIQYFYNLTHKDEKDWFNYFLLLKAYEEYGLTEEIEPYFVDKFHDNPEATFFKYLASRIYTHNGKTEKGYEVLNGIDHEKNPYFFPFFMKN